MPVVASNTYTGQPAASHTVPISTTPTAGNTLFLVVVAGAAPTTPAGWTKLDDATTLEALAWYRRTAVGDETGVQVDLSTSRALAAAVVERDDVGATHVSAKGQIPVSSTTISGSPVTTTQSAVVMSALGRAAVNNVTNTVTSTPGAGWTERADVRVDATANEDPWLTVVDSGDAAVGAAAYTPQVTTSAQIPGSAQCITIAFLAVEPPSAGENPIHAENLLTGNASSEWQVSGAGDTTCMGYCTAQTVLAGSTASFRVHCNEAFTVKIYRVGYYGGQGARLVATVTGTPAAQPAATVDPTTLHHDCSAWTTNATWAVPADACPGVYIARPSPDATPAQATHIPFVVRNPARKAPLTVVCSETTWQAYNYYGTPGAEFTGRSLYGQGTGFTLADRSLAVSFNRPYVTRADRPQSWLFNAEYPLIRFLEHCGYDLDYLSTTDVDADPSLLLGRDAVIVSGHAEYWSSAVRAGFDAARAAGVHLVFAAGDEAFWRVRYSADRRTMVCYKDTHNTGGVQADPVTWTGTWQDTRWEDRQPPAALTGQRFGVNGIHGESLTVPAAMQTLPLWRDCSFAGGDTINVDMVGFESDLPDPVPDVSTVRLSQTTYSVTGLLADANGETAGGGSGEVTHQITAYQAASGAIVFGLGTVQWAWGLDTTHDVFGGLNAGTASPTIRQATLNLLSDLGAQPVVIPAGLVEPTPVAWSAYLGATPEPPTTVTLTNTITGPSNQPVAGVAVRAVLHPAGAAFTTAETEIIGAATTTSNTLGEWTLSLIPQSRILPADSYYEIQEGNTVWARVRIPDAGPVNLHDARIT